MSVDLSDSELERYAAQIEHLGIDAQRRLKAARAIVLGGGPAGAAAAAELVSRGVGYVAVVDGATVAPGDLCGQVMLYTPDIGSNRAEAIVAKLGVLNPHVHSDSYPVDIEEQNAEAILLGHDIAIDCIGGVPGNADDTALVHARGDGPEDGIAAAAQAIELLVRAEVMQ